MGLVLRRNLSRRLTSGEVDGNFTYLASISGGTSSNMHFTSGTYDYWATQVSDNLLPQGYDILVTDRCDSGLILYCTSTNTFDYNGIGRFYVTDVQKTVDGNFGVWYPALESSLYNGAFIVWVNYHYLVIDITKFNGTDPNYNTDAYTLMSKSTSNFYIPEWDDIEYSFDTDTMLWRKDKRGNRVSTFSSSIDNFQWGDDNIHDCISETWESQIITLNNRGEITGKQVGKYTFVYALSNTGYIYYDINGSYQVAYIPHNTGNIESHIRGFSSGLQTQHNSGDIKVYIEDLSFCYAEHNTGDIYAKYENNSFVDHAYNAGNITSCDFNCFGKYYHFSVISLTASAYHYENLYSNNTKPFTFDPNTSYTNKILSNSESTFDSTLNASVIGYTSSNILDLTNYPYCGIIYLQKTN